MSSQQYALNYLFTWTVDKGSMVYTSRVFISSCCDCMVVIVPSKSDWNNKKILHGNKILKNKKTGLDEMTHEASEKT